MAACFKQLRYIKKMQATNIVKKVIGNRVGVSGNNRVPITSVDKLAEQNGHKAELQALRQEANRGDEIQGY